MQVAAHEKGQLHIFAVNRPTEELAGLFKPAEAGSRRLEPSATLLSDLTGTDILDVTGAELIPLRDLSGLGLSGYLVDGLDVDAGDLAPHKRRLDALDGYALILASDAFRGHAFTLANTASLTHIASFRQPGTDWSSTVSLASEAAKPHSGVRSSPREKRHRAQRLGGIIVAVFLLVIAAIVWAIAS